MKTTVEIEDGLLIKAKQRAAGLRLPLRDLIEAGLRNQLKSVSGRVARPPAIRWVTVPGGVLDQADMADRVEMLNRFGRSA